jgi:hypothetical protein
VPFGISKKRKRAETRRQREKMDGVEGERAELTGRLKHGREKV